MLQRLWELNPFEKFCAFSNRPLKAKLVVGWYLYFVHETRYDEQFAMQSSTWPAWAKPSINLLTRSHISRLLVRLRGCQEMTSLFYKVSVYIDLLAWLKSTTSDISVGLNWKRIFLLRCACGTCFFACGDECHQNRLHVYSANYCKMRKNLAQISDWIWTLHIWGCY